MNTTRRPAASLATETFDAETLALLEAVEVPLPEVAGLDLDVAFGTPLEMYEASPLPHERLDGLDLTAAIAVIEARENRMLAARDINADDQTIVGRVRERLVDVLLPYASALATTPVDGAEPVTWEPFTGMGCGRLYRAGRDATGRRTDHLVDQVALTVTAKGHWYRSDDPRDLRSNDRVCRGCLRTGHFGYQLDRVVCPSAPSEAEIRIALGTSPSASFEALRIPVAHAA